MQWTDSELAGLPSQDGFRLRGVDMTRLETFSDAAFAFAVTMLVISLERLPGNYAELMTALRGTPAFLASFAQIMLFWVGHRSWSRCYGLEDGVTTVLSLWLIFVMLVYVYPLKLMFSAFFFWTSGGFFPSEFAVSSAAEMNGLFIVYGSGFFAMAGALATLYRRALSAPGLALNTLEQLKTRQYVRFWAVQASVGLLSAMFALLMPDRIAVFAGFVYFLLPVAMPWLAIHHHKQVEVLRGA